MEPEPPSTAGATRSPSASPEKKQQRLDVSAELEEVLERHPPAKLTKEPKSQKGALPTHVQWRLPLAGTGKTHTLIGFSQGTKKNHTSPTTRLSTAFILGMRAQLTMPELERRHLLRAVLECIDKSNFTRDEPLEHGIVYADTVRLVLRLAEVADTVWAAAAKAARPRSGVGGNPAPLRPEFIMGDAIRFVLYHVKERMRLVADPRTKDTDLCHCPPLYWGKVICFEFAPVAEPGYSPDTRLPFLAKQLVSEYNTTVEGLAMLAVHESAALRALVELNEAVCAMAAREPERFVSSRVQTACVAVKTMVATYEAVKDEEKIGNTKRSMEAGIKEMKTWCEQAVMATGVENNHQSALMRLTQAFKAGAPPLFKPSGAVLGQLIAVISARCEGRGLSVGPDSWMVGRWPEDKVDELEQEIVKSGAGGDKLRTGGRIGTATETWVRIARAHMQK